jgi:hypothetical protein
VELPCKASLLSWKLAKYGRAVLPVPLRCQNINTENKKYDEYRVPQFLCTSNGSVN